jgi:DNA-binding NtrC family response regulator
MNESFEVLVAAESAESRRELGGILSRFGVQPAYSSTVQETKQILATRPVSLVFCEETLADGSFRDVLRALKARRAAVPVVISKSHDDWDNYLEALRLGAFEYLVGPFNSSDIEMLVRYAHRSAQAHSSKSLQSSAPQAA